MSLVIHPIGTELPFGGGTATVTGITLRGPRTDHVCYELTWWANGMRQVAWVEAVEIGAPKPALTIGFTG